MQKWLAPTSFYGLWRLLRYGVWLLMPHHPPKRRTRLVIGRVSMSAVEIGMESFLPGQSSFSADRKQTVPW